MITGCLRIDRESIFTGLNNVYSSTVTKNAYDEYFGFTEEESEDIYRKTGIEDRLPLMREWYDGYHSGDSDIFCPWDVIRPINDLCSKPTMKPLSYRNSTGDSSIIRSFIIKFRESVLKSLNALLCDGYIIRKVNEDVTYDCFHYLRGQYPEHTSHGRVSDGGEERRCSRSCFGGDVCACNPEQGNQGHIHIESGKLGAGLA